MQNARILIVDDNGAIHDDFRKILHMDSSGGSSLQSAKAWRCTTA